MRIEDSDAAQQEPSGPHEHHYERQSHQAVRHGQLHKIPRAQSRSLCISQEQGTRDAAQEKDHNETDGVRSDHAQPHEQFLQHKPVTEADQSSRQKSAGRRETTVPEDSDEQEPKYCGKSCSEEQGMGDRLHRAILHAGRSPASTTREGSASVRLGNRDRERSGEGISARALVSSETAGMERPPARRRKSRPSVRRGGVAAHLEERSRHVGRRCGELEAQGAGREG